MDDFLSFLGPFVLLGLAIAAFTLGLMFLIPASLVAIACVVIYIFLSPNSQRNQEKALIAETHRLYEQAQTIQPVSEDDYAWFVLKSFNGDAAQNAAIELFAQEGYGEPPEPPPIMTGIEGGRYRDAIKRFINANNTPQAGERFKREIFEAIKPYDDEQSESGFFNATRYLTNDDVGQLIFSFFGDHSFFKRLRDTLDANLKEQNSILPSDYTGKNCPWDYLKDTPLLPLERKAVDVQWQNRDAHTLILAGSGAGKTTLFKHMIAKLLSEDCCVVVMDSQSQLIEELAHIQLDEDELTWISPTHKLALNPFDADPDELKDETVINNRISLLEFVIENLIEAPMTPRQKSLFYYCTQLVLNIPGGNIGTFKEVLQDPFEFANHIDKLDETACKFFNSELRGEGRGRKGSNYDSTRDELSYRLDGLIKQPTFRRIFQTEENTFDFYDEMLDRRLILLDTSQSLLDDQSATLGRFFVAQALQACFERVKKKETERPVVFFIDEAHEVFDAKLQRMLLQARKANVAMVLATQDLSMATSKGITDTLLGSTATKLVSQVISSDARKLASRMKTSADFLISLPTHAFAFFSGDESTVTVRADPDPLSRLPRRGNLNLLIADMEHHYGPYEEAEKLKQNNSNDKYDSSDRPIPGSKRTMSENDDQDIEPWDTL